MKKVTIINNRRGVLYVALAVIILLLAVFVGLKTYWYNIKYSWPFIVAESKYTVSTHNSGVENNNLGMPEGVPGKPNHVSSINIDGVNYSIIVDKGGDEYHLVRDSNSYNDPLVVMCTDKTSSHITCRKILSALNK